MGLRCSRCCRDGDDLLPTGKFNEPGSLEHVTLSASRQDAASQMQTDAEPLRGPCQRGAVVSPDLTTAQFKIMLVIWEFLSFFFSSRAVPQRETR